MKRELRWVAFALLIAVWAACSRSHRGEDVPDQWSEDAVEQAGADIAPAGSDEADADPVGDVGFGDALICTEAGLRKGGILLLSADPLSTLQPMCESSWLHFDESGGYSACCDALCCSWSPNADGALPDDGEPCDPTVGCRFGLWCPEQTATCRAAQVDEVCSDKVHCDAGLICTNLGVCKAPIATEGESCSKNGLPCQFPMTCICVGAAGCNCHDGSAGDPCESDTCQAGLYCAPDPLQLSLPHCYNGDKGDPCEANWQCNTGLGCHEQPNDDYACAELLIGGQACAPGDTLAVCDTGYYCAESGESSLCKVLGGDGKECTSGAQCQPGYFCLKGDGHCWDGKDGDPCFLNSDCAIGSTCMGALEGPGNCVELLGEGDNCSNLSDFVYCDDGLVCSSANGTPTCRKPGQTGAKCTVDDDCAADLFCSTLSDTCMPGSDGVPCTGDEWCAPGWSCHPKLLLCYNGDFGDPCLDGECAEGFYCDEGHGKCYDGSPGSPCTSQADCVSGSCVGFFDGAVCFLVLDAGDKCGGGAPEYSFCGSGLHCVSKTSTCSAGAEGDPCSTSADCAEGLSCFKPDWSCVDGSLGDPCDGETDCAPGLVCNQLKQTCIQGLEGGPCQTDADCANGMQCQPTAQACYFGDNGDPCDAPSDCTEGYDCLMPINQCYDTLLGSPCLDDTWCQWGLSCEDIGELRCVEFLLADQVCAGAPDFVVCPPGTSCNFGLQPAHCAPLSETGEPCGDDADCVEPGSCDQEAGLCVETAEEETP